MLRDRSPLRVLFAMGSLTDMAIRMPKVLTPPPAVRCHRPGAPPLWLARVTRGGGRAHAFPTARPGRRPTRTDTYG